jgi:hypothetical protein
VVPNIAAPDISKLHWPAKLRVKTCGENLKRI